MSVSIKDKAKWLDNADVQALYSSLNSGGHEARIIGGAVRNALMGEGSSDIDFATTTVPDETIRRVEAAGFKAVPTGYAHGTITAVKNGVGFEVTTLRRDLVTNGRHAEVAFGTDWVTDAKRRDFTINALSCDADGQVFDYCGGLADIDSRIIRFIGKAETRIEEDHLRSLRFYRFFAYYGSGRPDADGIRATAKLKAGLAQLSAERIWSELKKLLAAPDPSRALLWMRQAGVLGAVLPESENWGIDAVPGLIETEKALQWPAHAMLRLASIIPPDVARVEEMAKRLKLSKLECDRIAAFTEAAPIAATTSETALAKRLYHEGKSGISDHLKLALAGARTKAVLSNDAMMEAGRLNKLLVFADKWQRPIFPVTGKDLKDKGFSEGTALGGALKAMEQRWIDSGFKLERDELFSLHKDL